MSIERLSVDELASEIKRDQTIAIQEVTETHPRQWVFEGGRLIRLHEQETRGDGISREAKVVLICDDYDVCLSHARKLDGFDVRYLAGGHLAWGQFYHPVAVGFDEQVQVWQIHRLAKGCLSYMIASGEEAILIDPAYHIDYFLGFAHSQKTDIKCVLDTQIHRDHVSGGARLAAKTGSPYYVPSHDDLHADSKPLEKQSSISLGKARMEVLSFPQLHGNQTKSVGLLLNDRFLFSADTPLVDQEARQNITDNPRLAQAAQTVIVLPAHAGKLASINDHGIVATTIAELEGEVDAAQEKRKDITIINPQVSEQEILEVNLMQKDISLDRANDLELGLDEL